jgi:hypothetical protein
MPLALNLRLSFRVDVNQEVKGLIAAINQTLEKHGED